MTSLFGPTDLFDSGHLQRARAAGGFELSRRVHLPVVTKEYANPGINVGPKRQSGAPGSLIRIAKESSSAGVVSLCDTVDSASRMVMTDVS
jgi:hypothetical protein